MCQDCNGNGFIPSGYMQIQLCSCQEYVITKDEAFELLKINKKEENDLVKKAYVLNFLKGVRHVRIANKEDWEILGKYLNNHRGVVIVEEGVLDPSTVDDLYEKIMELSKEREGNIEELQNELFDYCFDDPDYAVDFCSKQYPLFIDQILEM